MEDRRISEKFRKPRRTKGTPFFIQRNYYAGTVVALGALSWAILNYLPGTKRLKAEIRDGKFEDSPDFKVKVKHIQANLFSSTTGLLLAKARYREAEKYEEPEPKEQPCKSSERISKYFKRTNLSEGEEKPAESIKAELNEISSPYKDSIGEVKALDSSNPSDFKTPKAIKVNKTLDLKNKSKESKPKRKYTKRKNAANKDESKRMKQFLQQNDVDPEHLQMAIALSLSETSHLENSQESEQEPSTSGKKISVSLEQFGFKSKLKIAPTAYRQINVKKKKSKFKYVTPDLLLRSEEERDNLVKEKIALVLQNSFNNENSLKTNEPELNVESKELIDYWDKDCRCFKFERNCGDQFYVESLMLSPSKAKCGDLLKSWKDIAGRDPSPERIYNRTEEVPSELKILNSIDEERNSTDLEPNVCNINSEMEFLEKNSSPLIVSDSFSLKLSEDLNCSDSKPDLIQENHSEYLQSNSAEEQTQLDSLSKKKIEKRRSITPDLFDSDEEEPKSPSLLNCSPLKSKDLLRNDPGSPSTPKSADSTNLCRKNLSFSPENLSQLNLRAEVVDLTISSDEETNLIEEIKKSCTQESYKLKCNKSEEDLKQNNSETESKSKEESWFLSFEESTLPNIPIEKSQTLPETPKTSFCIKEKCSSNKNRSKLPRSSSECFFGGETEQYDNIPFDIDDFNSPLTSKRKSSFSRSYSENFINKATSSAISQNHCKFSPNISKIDEINSNSKSKKSLDSGSLSFLKNISKNSASDLNVTDYVNNLLTQDGELNLNDLGSSKLSQDSQNSECVVLSDEELNYSSHYNVNRNKYSLSDLEDEVDDDLNKVQDNLKDAPPLDYHLSADEGSNKLRDNMKDDFIVANKEPFIDHVSDEEDSFDKMINKPNLSLLCKSLENEKAVTESNSTVEDNLDDSFDCLVNKPNVSRLLKSFEEETELMEVETEVEEKLDPVEIIKSKLNIVTPSNKFIIKHEKVTPMQNYDAMDTPKIELELQKFGLKPLKRQKGAKLLKYIYESTHPLLNLEDANEEHLEEQSIAKKRRISKSPKRSQDVIFQAAADKTKIIGDLLLQNEKPEDLIFERKQSVRIRSCKVPLQIVWYNFLCNNPEIEENILLYEPLQLEVLYKSLNDLGFKFHIQDLTSFLDKKCITIRTAQGRQRLKKK